jgi:hypothetical protein
MNASETRRTRSAWLVTKITAKTVILSDIDTQADSGLDPLVGSIAGTAIGSKGQVMRASTKMMQNGKTKARSGGGHKSATTGRRARVRKLPSRDINRKIWHNWLTEENPFFK